MKKKIIIGLIIFIALIFVLGVVFFFTSPMRDKLAYQYWPNNGYSVYTNASTNEIEPVRDTESAMREIQFAFNELSLDDLEVIDEKEDSFSIYFFSDLLYADMNIDFSDMRIDAVSGKFDFKINDEGLYDLISIWGKVRCDEEWESGYFCSGDDYRFGDYIRLIAD